MDAITEARLVIDGGTGVDDARSPQLHFDAHGGLREDLRTRPDFRIRGNERGAMNRDKGGEALSCQPLLQRDTVGAAVSADCDESSGKRSLLLTEPA
jgi:hypothetical protein